MKERLPSLLETRELLRRAKTKKEREYLVTICEKRGWHSLLPPLAQRHPHKWIKEAADEEVDV